MLSRCIYRISIGRASEDAGSGAAVRGRKTMMGKFLLFLRNGINCDASSLRFEFSRAPLLELGTGTFSFRFLETETFPT